VLIPRSAQIPQSAAIAPLLRRRESHLWQFQPNPCVGKHPRDLRAAGDCSASNAPSKVREHRKMNELASELAEAHPVRIRFGYEFIYSVPQLTPMIFALHCQPNETQRVIQPDFLRTEPAVPLSFYQDTFGNTCTRLEAPAGPFRATADGVMEDCGAPEPAQCAAAELAVQELPVETLQYLLGSRYCETDLLMNDAWRLFGQLSPGWSRVQAICDFVNREISFGYQFARPTKTALDTFKEGQGVCRDMAHLAITFCRCLNIPARYSSTYLGDIGVPPADAPMDFAACIEVFLSGRWHVFDPRNNARRIGRIVVARGRDAGDVAFSTAFGAPCLQTFRVWTDEVTAGTAAQASPAPAAQAA
jgi:transglutaminase-like putative cysteine protease